MADFTPGEWIELTKVVFTGLGAVLGGVAAVYAVIGAKRAERAVATSAANGANIALIERNTNSMTTRIEQLARKEGEVIGEAKGTRRGEATAATLAEGQRQGRELASNQLSSAPGDAPVPVVDDKVAEAIKQSAMATEHVAAAAKNK